MSNNNAKTFVVIQTSLDSCKRTTLKYNMNIQTYNLNISSVVHRGMQISTSLAELISSFALSAVVVTSSFFRNFIYKDYFR